MQTVWKAVIKHTEDARIKLPLGAKLVHVGLDSNEDPCVWYQCDPQQVIKEERQFGIYGTGGMVPDCWEYVGTFMEETFVWHVFENKGH